MSDKIFSLYWNIKIYRGKSVEEGVGGRGGDSFKFLSHRIIPRQQYFFYFKGWEKGLHAEAMASH